METLPDLGHLKELIAQASVRHTQLAGFAAVRIKMVAEIGAGFWAYKKKIGHGNWLSWLDQHFGDVTPRTAQKWMKLSVAVEKKEIDFDGARGIRDAYMLSGIIPDPPESSPHKTHTAANYLVHLDRFEAEMRDIDVTKLSSQDRSLLKQRLQRIVRIYELL
jgi:hypothetical protein